MMQMKVSIVGAIVKDVKDWTTDRSGKELSLDKVTSQITLFDRESGGDVSLTFPSGHGLVVGQDVTAEYVVRPVYNNFKLSLYVQVPARNAPKK